MAAGYDREAVMASIYAKSRDNARTPMQWDGSANAGFTEGEPWIGVNPNFREINAAAQTADPDSVFRFYQRLVALRKEYPVFVDGRFDLLFPEDEKIFAYTRTSGRTRLLVLANFSKENASCALPEEWRDAQVLVHNCTADLDPATGKSWRDGALRPYEAVIALR